MAGIKYILQFADSHGVLHPTAEAAVLAERRIMITDMVLADHAKLGLSFAEINETVDVLIAAQPKMAEIMAVDLKRGLYAGGLVTGGTDMRVGERPSDSVLRPESSVTRKAKDADGETIYVGNPVTLINEAPADREKWGETDVRVVRAITPDGALLFDDGRWKWRGESLRKMRV